MYYSSDFTRQTPGRYVETSPAESDGLYFDSPALGEDPGGYARPPAAPASTDYRRAQPHGETYIGACKPVWGSGGWPVAGQAWPGASWSAAPWQFWPGGVWPGGVWPGAHAAKNAEGGWWQKELAATANHAFLLILLFLYLVLLAMTLCRPAASVVVLGAPPPTQPITPPTQA